MSVALGRKAPTSHVSDSSRDLGVFVSRKGHQSDPQGHTVLRTRCSITKPHRVHDAKRNFHDEVHASHDNSHSVPKVLVHMSHLKDVNDLFNHFFSIDLTVQDLAWYCAPHLA